MRKTFKSVCVPGLELNISPSHQGIALTVTMDEELCESQGITLSHEDAPALALAILEAAGVEESSPHYGLNDSPEWNLRWASHYLGRSIELTNTQAAEAEAQAKLEAEALELFKTLMGVKGYENFTWSEVIDKDEWLAVARKAREINKEEK